MLKNVTEDDVGEAESSSKALVLQWLEQCVVGLGLCPYARAPLAAAAVKLVCSFSADEKVFMELLLEEARQLNSSGTESSATEPDSAEIETTLIIAVNGFEGFFSFNDFCADAEDALVAEQLDQDFQLASFHPDYLFAGDPSEDPAHFTNRAPYPIIQLLRVATVARAVDGGDTLSIPQRNCERLRSMQKAELRKLFPWSAHWVDL